MIKEKNIAVCVILSIVTFGIYYIYWNYKIGKVMYEAKLKSGIQSNNHSVIYLILTITGLGIVNYCLIQNELNKIATI